MGEQKRRKRGLAPRPTSITGERMFHLPQTRSDTYTGTMRAADLADHEARLARRAGAALEYHEHDPPTALHEPAHWGAGHHWRGGRLDARGYPAETAAFGGYLGEASNAEQCVREGRVEPTLSPPQVGILLRHSAKWVHDRIDAEVLPTLHHARGRHRRIRIRDFYQFALAEGYTATEVAGCYRQIVGWLGAAVRDYAPPGTPAG
jgi:hypothetical protein